jgi:hypothetical protein
MPRFNVFTRFRQWWVRHGASDEQQHAHQSDDGYSVAEILRIIEGKQSFDIPQFFPSECDWRERYRHGWAGEQRQPDDQCEHRGASRC